MNAMENAKGEKGPQGKDANFAALVDGVLKSGTIVDETVTDEENKEGVSNYL